MNLLIIGIDSFTGKYLQSAFEKEGWSVFGTTIFPKQTTKRIFYADLLAPEHFDSVLKAVQPHVVINLAAISFVAENQIAPFYAVNVAATAALLEKIQRFVQHIHCIIQPSSANIYGTQAGLLNEKTPAAPQNHYACSKWAMEQMLHAFDLPILITRPFNYTGRGQSPRFLIAKLVEHFKRRAPILQLGNLDIARDFTDVRDVARAYVGLVQSKVQRGVWNIASGKPLFLKDILKSLENLTHHHPTIEVDPQLVRENEIKSLSGDASLLTQTIGHWRQVEDFEETLRWMLQDE